MPTSLTHIILLARGFSPWRPVADMCTARGKVRCSDSFPRHPHLVFKDRRRHSGSDKNPVRLCRPRQAHLQPNCFRALSETSRSPFGSRQKEKKTLPRAHPGVAVFTLVTDFDTDPGGRARRAFTHTHTSPPDPVSPPLPVPGAGILTGFPFVRRARRQTRRASERH